MFELDQWLSDPLPDEEFTAEELAGAQFVDEPDYLFKETSADVLAVLATVDGLGPQTLVVLESLPKSEFSDEGRLNFLQTMTGYSAYVESLKLEMVASYAGLAPDPDWPLDDDFAAHEVAVATKCNVYAADRAVALSRDLFSRLPATWRTMHVGDISECQAQHLAQATRHLPLDVARKVEADALRLVHRHDMTAFCAAVRRALARHDPDFEPRAKKAREECVVAHTANADGTGDLFIRGPLEITEQLRRILDAYAARTKPTLGGTAAQRKLAGMRDLCDQYLGSGDAPRNHGRLPIVNVCIDLATLLGLANHPAEIPGVGMVPADVARWLLADGAPLRKFLIDDNTGALMDMTTDAYVVPPVIAEFLCLRNVKSASPHSNVDSTVSDMEHNIPHDKGGGTDPFNNTPVDRRWHVPKTRDKWKYRKHRTTGVVTWYSPNGLSCQVDPHDYRLGP